MQQELPQIYYLLHGVSSPLFDLFLVLLPLLDTLEFFTGREWRGNLAPLLSVSLRMLNARHTFTPGSLLVPK